MKHTIDKLIEKHRHVNVEDDWWEPLEERFIKTLQSIGIHTSSEQVHFTGFYSQGDGACYSGDIRVEEFLAAHPHLLEQFPHHKQMYELNGEACSMSLHVSGRCSHEYSMTLSLWFDDAQLESFYDTSTPLGKWAHDQLDQGIEQEADAWEATVLEVCRDYARQFFVELEKEFEYLTSDEAVKAWLDSNGMVEAA